MKLLLDVNIFWRLTDPRKRHFTDSVHGIRTGLPFPATDRAIWNFAKEKDFIIGTNDEDFLNFSNTKGFPPKVILFKTRNKNNQFILSHLLKHKAAIASLNDSAEYGLLEIY